MMSNDTKKKEEKEIAWDIMMGEGIIVTQKKPKRKRKLLKWRMGSR